jgi:hypothetical protein
MRRCRHREGDLICGKANTSVISTLVERSIRFTILVHLSDGHDAEHVQQAIIDKMGSLPGLLRNSRPTGTKTPNSPCTSAFQRCWACRCSSRPSLPITARYQREH